MLRVGLTGGVGSGKSTAASRFEELDVPVIDADVIAHALVEPSQPAFQEVFAVFGHDVIEPAGTLDRARLRQLVFKDPDKRQQLEAILHPRVRRRMLEQMAMLDAPYCVLVIPLLIESQQHDLVDRILVVDAPDDCRIQWIKRRSGMTETEILDIFDAQIGRSDRLAAADDLLVNDGDIPQLLRQVDEMHQRYCALATVPDHS